MSGVDSNMLVLSSMSMVVTGFTGVPIGGCGHVTVGDVVVTEVPGKAFPMVEIGAVFGLIP